LSSLNFVFPSYFKNLCYARTSTTNIENNNNLWAAEAPKTTKQPIRQFPLRPRIGGSGFGFVGNRQRLNGGDRRMTNRKRHQQAKKQILNLQYVVLKEIDELVV